DRRLDNAMNLGFALRPEPRHHFAFFFEINLHLGEFLNDSLDTVPELGAGQVPVDQFHFRLLSLVGLSRGADFDQRLTERNGKRHYKAEIRDPDAVNAVKGLDAFRQSSRDEDGNIGSGSALVRAEFCKPIVRPIFGSFRFPKQRAKSLVGRPNDTLHDVAAKLSLADRLNRIMREVSAQYCFEFKFEDLALQLLRTLFGLTLKLIDLALHRGDLLLFLSNLEFEALLYFRLRLLPDFDE